MSTHTFLPNPGVLALDRLTVDTGVIVFRAHATREVAACPLCRHPSERIHSRYRRVLLDLPWQGNAVRFELTCRKFFCDNPECTRCVFVEALPAVAERYARKTCRLADALRELCYLVGGEAAARIARRFGLLVSADALLRQLTKRFSPTEKSPRVLGVDDFAFCRGHTYGTILVDLERHRPIDLLPNREPQTLATWLREHPGVEIISRDRGNPYIEGATKGAPEALQVADRWHLLKNLGDSLERLLIRHSKTLREAAKSTPAKSTPAVEEPSQEQNPAAATSFTERSLTCHEQDRQQRRDRRLARYEEVCALYRQGLTLRAIGKKTDIDRRTVQKFIRSGTFPEIAARPKRQSKIEPFGHYLRRRWEEGYHNGALLRRELLTRGYTGSQETVDRFLRGEGMKAIKGSGTAAERAAQARFPAPRRLAWLLTNTKNPKVAERDRALVQRLGEICPQVGAASEMGSAFCSIVRERRADDLDQWLEKVGQEGLPEMQRFAQGIAADKAAVMAALSLDWSNGQTEGQINRLKFVKRQMYGRAGFDLLKARFLPTELSSAST